MALSAAVISAKAKVTQTESLITTEAAVQTAAASKIVATQEAAYNAAASAAVALKACNAAAVGTPAFAAVARKMLTAQLAIKAVYEAAKVVRNANTSLASAGAEALAASDAAYAASRAFV